MIYTSTWKNIKSNKIINIDNFVELDDALEDVFSTLWGGASPILITVTDECGELIAKRQIGYL